MSATVGSLFSGIGGLELGLEASGLGPVLWQVESDAYCREALARHWPEAKRFDDVRTVGAHNLEPVDIVCGGFPCQDISVAGSGEGLGGARSGLWSEYARIVRELRPRFVVVENVAALLGRGLGTVLGDLAALGFDAWWDCIPAAAVGAPHRRDRLFVVAWRVSDAERDGLRHEPERGRCAAPAADGGHAEPQHVGAGLGDSAGARLAWTEAGEERGGSAAALAAGDDLADADGAAGRRAARHAVAGDGSGAPGRWPAEPRGRGRGADVADSHGGRFESERLESEQGPSRQRRERRHELDRRDLPLWPPAPDDVHAWGGVPPDAQPAVCRMADGIPTVLVGGNRGVSRGPALRSLGNAVVPQVAEVIGGVVATLYQEVA